MDPRQRLAMMAARLDKNSVPGKKKSGSTGVPRATLKRRKLKSKKSAKAPQKSSTETIIEQKLSPRSAAAAIPAPASAQGGAKRDWATRALAFGTNVHHQLGMPAFSGSMTAKPKPVLPLDYGNPVMVECSATATFLVLDNGRLLASGEGALGIKVPKRGAAASASGADGRPPLVGTVEPFKPAGSVRPLVRSTAHNLIHFPSKGPSHCSRVLQVSCGWGHHCAAIVQQFDIDPNAMSRPSTSNSLGRAAGAGRGGRDGSPGGELWTWGLGERGQLGHGPGVSFLPTPRKVAALANADAADADAADVCVRVACGELHTVVVMRGGALFAFGHGAAGQLGLPQIESMDASANGSSDPNAALRPSQRTRARSTGKVSAKDRLRQCAAVPHRVPLYAGEFTAANPRAVDVACGLNHTMVLTSCGAVHTCGWGEDGRLGHNDEERQLELTEVVIVSGGSSGDPSDTYSYGLTPRGVEISQIACGGAFCLALDYDGKVFSWGNNSFKQLGRKTPIPKGTAASIDEITGLVTPAKPAGKPLNWRPGLVRGLMDAPGRRGGQRVERLACGFAHCLALVLRDAGDRALFVWGWGEEGQLGLGTECNAPVPQELQLSKKPAATAERKPGSTVIAPLQFAAGRSHSVVIIGRRSADVADDEDGDALLQGLQEAAMEETRNVVAEVEEAKRKAEAEAEAARLRAEEEAEAKRLEEERIEREMMEEAKRRTAAARAAREAEIKAAAERRRAELEAKFQEATRATRDALAKLEDRTVVLDEEMRRETAARKKLEVRLRNIMSERRLKAAKAAAEARLRAEEEEARRKAEAAAELARQQEAEAKAEAEAVCAFNMLLLSSQQSKRHRLHFDCVSCFGVILTGETG